jgi:outer membrane protein TolC
LGNNRVTVFLSAISILISTGSAIPAMATSLASDNAKVQAAPSSVDELPPSSALLTIHGPAPSSSPAKSRIPGPAPSAIKLASSSIQPGAAGLQGPARSTIIEPPITLRDVVKSSDAKSANANANAGAAEGTYVASAAPAQTAAFSRPAESIQMVPFRNNDFVPTSGLHPVRLEASYNEAITLKEALDYAMHNNLPIRISRESWKYQRFGLLGATAGAMPFLPETESAIGQTYSKVQGQVRSNSFVFQQVFEWPIFTGGLQFYTMASQYYREKGWKEAHYASVNDALLDVFIKYENLVLQHALLRVKAKDLHDAKADMEFDYANFLAKKAPLLEYLDSKMEFATVRHDVLQQQLAVRNAALDLAVAMNMPTAINLIPMEKTITQKTLVDENININSYMKIALDQRPELRQFQFFRLAANRSIPIPASQLYPNLTFFVAYTHANDIVTPATGNIGGLATAQIASTLQFVGAPSNNALGETPSFSPEENKTASSTDINTIDTSVVAASGGLPQNLVQAGSLVLSGAVAPTTATPSVTFNGTTASTNLSGANTSSFGVFPGVAAAWQSGFLLNYYYYTGENFGSVPQQAQGFQYVAQTAAARALARQALLQANQGLQLVESQVRTSYLSASRARDKFARATRILNTYVQAVSLVEAERAKQDNERLREELELAQNKASDAQQMQLQSIYLSNISQARILHDIGVISMKTLTEGYRIGDPKEKRKHP